jgi:hypothetical protein
MGVGSSVPLRNDFKNKTIRTSELVEKILAWMLKESNLLDYYALASPTHCKEYVMFTADNLDSLFKDIDVVPLNDKKTNKIYFRKVSELKVMPAELEQKRRVNCYNIAYFFIRILQVFSALALSVLDTTIPQSYDEMLQQIRTSKNIKYISPEEFKTIPLLSRAKPEKKKWSFFGGSLAPGNPSHITNVNYKILNDYLSVEKGDTLQLYDETGRATGLFTTGANLRNNQYGFTLNDKDFSGKDATVAASVRIDFQQLGGEDIYTVFLFNIYLDAKEVKKDKYEAKTATFKKPTGSVLHPTYYTRTIPRYILAEFSKILGKPISDDASNVKTIKGIKNLPRDIDPKFQVREIWQSLSQKPPVKAYCVARALQLLSPEAIYDSSLKQSARTSICNTKFALQDTHSVPTPQQSITSSYGILSLNLLFFDVLENTVPSIKEKEEYKNYLNILRVLYEERTELATEELRNLYSDIDGIKEKTNPTLCAGKTGPLYTKDKETARQLRSYATQLMDRQLVHTANVVKVLEQLFVIQEGKPLLLQPAVEDKGIEEVNRIAGVARQLLISYYSDCEKLYRDGVIAARDRKNTFQNA